jgi:6-phosphofructokinase 1
MSIGVLTAGGDCPGLNAAIRAIVTRLAAAGAEVVGIEKGWHGLMDGRTRPLHRSDVRGIIARGGTILGTSRIDPYVHGNGYSSVAPTIEAAGIETLIVLGGDGSLRTAARLHQEGGRVGVVGIPKTIDNDISGTDVSLGFHTAVQIVVDAIDRLTTTAESHDRIMVVEVMGRTAGWIATCSGIAGGAEAIVVPEAPTDYEDLARHLIRRHSEGHSYSLVVVAEGARNPSGEVSTVGLDSFGFQRLGGVGGDVARELETRTGYEARVMTLGYLQRGGTPTAFDRLLGTRFGIEAAELALQGATGLVVALRGDAIATVGLDEVVNGVRSVDNALLAGAAWFLA